MKSIQLSDTEHEVTRLSYGCMRIAGTWNPAEVDDAKRGAAFAALDAAWESGYRLFDHADIYAQGACETLFGEWMRVHNLPREEVFIATKCGIRFPGDPNPDSPHRYDFSHEHILESCDKSLERLGVECVDLYQLHRPDLLMNPHEVAKAFQTLHFEGKVKYFGVSNFLPSFVEALQSAVTYPLVVNQVEIHLGRLACFYDGTLDQCLAHNMIPLAWSPLGGGWLGDGGNVPDWHPQPEKGQALLDLLDSIAKRLGVSRTVLNLAWLLKHPSRIVPIVGSVHPDRIRDAAKADEIDLDREDWYRILVAARGEKLP